MAADTVDEKKDERPDGEAENGDSEEPGNEADLRSKSAMLYGVEDVPWPPMMFVFGLQV